MKILFELTKLQNIEYYSGILEYGKTIFINVLKNNINSEIYVLLENKKELSPELNKVIQNYSVQTIFIDKIEHDFNPLLASKKFDIVYVFYQPIEFKYVIPKSTQLIVTVHDLIQLKTWKLNRMSINELDYYDDFKIYIKNVVKVVIRLFKLKYYKYYQTLLNNIYQASIVITDSYYSKQDLLKYYSHLEPDKIVVLYPPLKEISFDRNQIELKRNDFFFLLSANRFTKNVNRGVYALDELYSENKIYEKTVILGNLPKSVIKKIKHKEKFIFKDYIDEIELESLYYHTKLFIFPSLYEGFGYPPLEALKYSTNIAVSCSSSLNELFNQTRMFNPYNLNDMKNAILFQLNHYDKSLLDNLFEKITTKQKDDLGKITSLILTNTKPKETDY